MSTDEAGMNPVLEELISTHDGRVVLATTMESPVRCPGNWIHVPQEEQDPARFEAVVAKMSAVNCAYVLKHPFKELAPWQQQLLQKRAAAWEEHKAQEFRDRVRALTTPQLRLLTQYVTGEVKQFAEELLAAREIASQ